jgi:hypothetical protein
VTQHDDLTIRDLYRNAYFQQEADPPFTKWMKATIILERASKLTFIDPDEDSDYAKAWSRYHMHTNPPHANSNLASPPAWLDQPKYRCPKDFAEVRLALDQLRENMGTDGIFPVDRRRNAEIDGGEEPSITPHTIMLVRASHRDESTSIDHLAPPICGDSHVLARHQRRRSGKQRGPGGRPKGHGFDSPSSAACKIASTRRAS